MELTLLLFGVCVGAVVGVWHLGRRGRDALDIRVHQLEARIERLEQDAEEDDRWTFLPTGDEPESIAEATRRARQLTQDDLAAARARLRSQRESDPDS